MIFKKISIDNITVGNVFSYFGPILLDPLRRGVAFGKIIGFEDGQDVVHVRTYRENNKSKYENNIDIGHIPIKLSFLRKSINKIHGKSKLDYQWIETIYIWRKRNKRGEVGAFSVPLWRAEKLAKKTLAENFINYESLDFDKICIEYAFPKNDDNGVMRVVEISCLS